MLQVTVTAMRHAGGAIANLSKLRRHFKFKFAKITAGVATAFSVHVLYSRHYICIFEWCTLWALKLE